ncbi:N-acetylneuraminate synthase [archaeon]|jgi:sialic acid synthase SpsE|nr:N-acetylneuraminate synthase [archaeon]
MAFALVDAAVEAQADWVKFQTFRAESLVTKSVPLAEYQKHNATVKDVHVDNQFTMLKNLELDHATHLALRKHCKASGIQFLSTPFDHESLDFLVNDMGLDTLKLGSGDLTNAPLLLEIGRTGCSLILSTGMADIKEIDAALGVLAFGYIKASERPCHKEFKAAWQSKEGRRIVQERVTLLHCTSAYPAPIEDVNLRVMETLRERFNVSVGFSDHTKGVAAAVASAVLGASFIEKHLTLDNTLQGPDHAMSCEPEEFARLVSEVKIARLAMGSGTKLVAKSEDNVRSVARKSLVCLSEIREGELFDETTLAVKRPGTGISALEYYEWLGRPAAKNYSKDDIIND